MQNKWWALFVLFFARLALGYQFQAAASSGRSLIDEFSVDYTAVGAFVGLFTLPGIVGALASGLLGRKYGNRHLVCWGLFLMALGGAVTAVSTDFTVALAGRLVTGFGAIVLFVLLTKMTADWFSGKQLGLAMGIGINGFPLGIGAGLLLHGMIADAYSWRGIFWSTSMLATAALALLIFAYRNPKELAGAPVAAPAGGMLNGREWLLASFSAVGFTLYYSGTLVVITFMPDVLVAKGMQPTQAALFVNAHLLVSVIGVSVGGYIAGTSLRNVGLFVSCAGIVGLLAGIAYGDLAGFAFVAMGLIGGGPAALLMSLPAYVLRPASRDVGYGVFFTWVYGGLAGSLALAGFAREQLASPIGPIVLGAALVVLIPLWNLIFQWVVSRRPTAVGAVA